MASLDEEGVTCLSSDTLEQQKEHLCRCGRKWRGCGRPRGGRSSALAAPALVDSSQGCMEAGAPQPRGVWREPSPVGQAGNPRNQWPKGALRERTPPPRELCCLSEAPRVERLAPARRGDLLTKSSFMACPHHSSPLRPGAAKKTVGAQHLPKGQLLGKPNEDRRLPAWRS